MLILCEPGRRQQDAQMNDFSQADEADDR